MLFPGYFLPPVNYGDNGDKKTSSVCERMFLNVLTDKNYLEALFLAMLFLIFLASSVSLLLEVDSK